MVSGAQKTRSRLKGRAPQTAITKRLILVTSLGPGRVFANEHIAVLKIQLEVCKDGRRV